MPEYFLFNYAVDQASGPMTIEKLANRTVSSGAETQATLSLQGHGTNTQADFRFTIQPKVTA